LLGVLVEGLNPSAILTLKLTIVFAVALSLASLPGPLSNHLALPNILPLAHANLAPNEVWYPAGPSMDTMIIKIYQDQVTEFNDLKSQAIDLTDWRLDAGTTSAICNNASFYCTSQIQEKGYSDIEFNLANTFWGISMKFGNDPSGLQLRQGIAHLIDKNAFSTNEPSGPWTPIDNPLPASESFGGTLVTYPNPCLWDENNTQTGVNCQTTTTGLGGLAYHLAAATTLNCGTEAVPAACTYRWQPGFGSLDFCAAANHFITAFRHGLGINPTKDANCVLLAPGQTTPGVGWPATVTGFNAPQFFVRVDDPPRFDAGNSLVQEICALFTGQFITGGAPCDPSPSTGFLHYKAGTVTSFPVFPCPFADVCPTDMGLSWWIYTGALGNVFPFDASLYFSYNSRFVSGVPADQPPCSPAAVPSPNPSNYMYLCNSAYDTASSNVEFATSLSNAFSAATDAMDIFGKNAFTIPIYTPSDTFGYLSNWSRVINSDGNGIPSALSTSTGFSWLNGYTATPSTGTNGCATTTPLCLRQGFKEPIRSLTPYASTTPWDAYFLNNIYDTLTQANPESIGQLFDWMTISTQELSNTQLNYIPPGCTSQTVCTPGVGTVDTYRFTLRNDIFWQDHRKLTSWDVQFSYATGFARGAPFYGGLAPMVCTTPGNCSDGVTVLSPTQFDVHVFEKGPFTRIGVSTDWIIPGRYWSANCANSTWDSDVVSGNVPASCMTTNLATSSEDALGAGILVGSGPFECVSPSACSSTSSQTVGPGGTYTLQRFGSGHAPGSSVTDSYFRSSGALALYLWSGNTGDPTGDSINFSRVAACFGQAVGAAGCGHWQKGLGNPGAGTIIGGIQASIVLRFVFVNFVSPFNVATSPPQGMVTFPPATLYEGSAILNNCVVDPTSGYDC
jgi:ABC-type transport system substrate-binding protein